MKGFDPRFTDLPDYILKCTAQIWEGHDIAALEQDRPGDYAQLIDALHSHKVFAFDRAVVLGLMAQTADPVFDEMPPKAAA